MVDTYPTLTLVHMRSKERYATVNCGIIPDVKLARKIYLMACARTFCTKMLHDDSVRILAAIVRKLQTRKAPLNRTKVEFEKGRLLEII